MRTHVLVLAITMSMLVPALARTARAEEGPGTRAVRKANEEITKLLAQKVEPGSAAEKQLAARVTTSVRGFLDVEALGKRALRDHWDKISAAEQREFQTLLRELIEKSYVKGLRANVAYQVVYTGEKRAEGEIVVSTEVKTKRRGRPYTIKIDYVLAQERDAWRAIDVITDGVGLVENYRAQFNKIIAQHGMSGLIERMKKKAAKEE